VIQLSAVAVVSEPAVLEVKLASTGKEEAIFGVIHKV
jgi:hypothetical protein